MVKKCGLLKIVHDHFKRTRQGEDPILAEYISSFETAIEHNKDVDGLISKNQVRVRLSSRKPAFRVYDQGPVVQSLTMSLRRQFVKYMLTTYHMQKHHYFLLEKCENLLQCKRFSHFSNKK